MGYPTMSIGVALVATSVAATQVVAQEVESSWEGHIGIGLRHEPVYSGSDKTENSAALDINLTWNNLLFVSSETGVGAYLLNAERTGGDFTLGLAVGYDANERLVADDNRLSGLRDVKGSPTLQLLMEYDLGLADVELNVSRAFGSDGHEGLTAELSANFEYQLSTRTYLGFSPSITWANSNYMTALYGVSSGQAANSNFSKHKAGSGIENVGVELSITHLLNDSFGLYGAAEYSALQGDAKNSPVTFDSSQLELTTGIVFRF
ncbi:MipA/OmpV family protein [Epibacterium ulvae]|uniref:MipA/OmpV family protein n=1 Tax=Epibacterium ulvae TaxID=1156985 RepID=UPI00249294E0|nr:MipA/OmpV family protein [Epibacterium ulvae]